MPKGIYIRTKEHGNKIKQGHSKHKGQRMPQMARKGKANGMFGTKGNFDWRDISGLRSHKIGEYTPTKETRLKISKANTTDSRNYSTLHKWLYRHKGKAFGCVDCGSNDININYEWSNVSHEYLRDLNDWVSRCIPCHRKYDGNDKLYLHSPLYKKYTNSNE